MFHEQPPAERARYGTYPSVLSETCPVFPGKTYEDWPLDDPKGEDLGTLRRIGGEVEERVVDLLARIA